MVQGATTFGELETTQNQQIQATSLVFQDELPVHQKNPDA